MRSIGLIVFCTLSADFASAQDSIEPAPVSLNLPKTWISENAKGTSGESTVQRQSLDVDGDFPARLTGLSAKVNYIVKSLSFDPDGRIITNVEMTRVQAVIQDFDLDANLEREVLGTIVRVHIAAKCKNMTLESKLPFEAQVKSRLLPSKKLGMTIEELAWSKNPDQWSMNVESCEGPAGLVPYFTSLINKQWTDSAIFKELVRKQVELQLNQWMLEQSVFGKTFETLKISLGLKALELTDVGSALNLKLIGELSKGEEICPIVSKAQGPVVSPEYSVGNIFIPDAFVIGATECLHRLKRLKRNDYSKDIPAFISLLDSWFAKYFVWPDLARYSSRDQFRFVTSSYGQFAMSPVVDNKKGRAQYKISTSVVTNMYIDKQNRLTPYVTFSSPLVTNAQLSEKAGLYTLAISGTPSLRLNYRFDLPANQIQDSTIYTSQLESSVASSLAETKIQFAAPELRINASMLAGFAGMARSKFGVTFGIKITKLP